VTGRSLTLLVIALGGLLGWIGGVLAYANWFSETGRAGGGLVKGGMWASAFVGLAATVGFGLSIWRRPRA
jgi:hypothetical protein